MELYFIKQPSSIEYWWKCYWKIMAVSRCSPSLLFPCLFPPPSLFTHLFFISFFCISGWQWHPFGSSGDAACEWLNAKHTLRMTKGVLWKRSKDLCKESWQGSDIQLLCSPCVWIWPLKSPLSILETSLVVWQVLSWSFWLLTILLLASLLHLIVRIHT